MSIAFDVSTELAKRIADEASRSDLVTVVVYWLSENEEIGVSPFPPHAGKSLTRTLWFFSPPSTTPSDSQTEQRRDSVEFPYSVPQPPFLPPQREPRSPPPHFTHVFPPVTNLIAVSAAVRPPLSSYTSRGRRPFHCTSL